MQKRLAYGSNLPYNTRATLDRANKAAGYDPEVLRLERSLQQVERQVIPFRHDKCPAGFDEYTRLPQNYPYAWKNSKNRFCVDPNYPNLDTTHRYDPLRRRDMDRDEMMDTYLTAAALLEADDDPKKKSAEQRLEHRKKAQEAYAKTVATGKTSQQTRAKDDLKRTLGTIKTYENGVVQDLASSDEDQEKLVRQIENEIITKVTYDHKGRLRFPNWPAEFMEHLKSMAPKNQTKFIDAITRYVQVRLQDQQKIQNALRHAFRS